MRLTKSDLPLLRKNILVLYTALLLSAATVYGSSHYANMVRQQLHAAQRQYNDARAHVAAMQEAQRDLAAYADGYEALVQRHVLGDERRLDWMEGLEQIRRQQLVAGFHYRIGPQRSYPAPAVPAGDNFEVRASTMRLQFDLLHEGQLLDFFAALRDNVSGWYLLDGCALQRVSGAAHDAATQLRAECSGNWITLRRRGLSQ